MLAIHTKLLPATPARGARLKATWGEKNDTYSYQHELDARENHREAASRLLNAHNGSRFGDFVSGELPDGSYAHIFAK